MTKRIASPILPPTTPEETRSRSGRTASDESVSMAEVALGLKKAPERALDLAIAFSTAALGAAFEMPAASIFPGAIQIGLPHNHTHVPALPIPLPSFGVLVFGGSQSVLVDKRPGAQTGDIGVAITCGSYSPFFQVTTGSSKVFFGSKRAARSLDLTTFCKAPKTLSGRDLAEAMADHIGGAAKVYTKLRRATTADALAGSESDEAIAESLTAEARGHTLAAAVHAQEAITSALVKALQQTVGKDSSSTPVLALQGALCVLASTVLIGGFPMPPSMKAVSGLKKTLKEPVQLRSFIRYARGVLCLAPVARAVNAIAWELRVLVGHPVDVVTGNLVFAAHDFELPGALPLRLSRHYSSSWSTRDSPLGRGWSHSLDEAVWLEPRHLVYRAEDGRELELPRTDEPELFIPLHRLTLRRLGPDRWQIEDHEGICRDFASLVGDPHPGVARLVQRRDRVGHTLRLRYDDQARLVGAHVDGEREVRLHHDADGRLVRVDLPNPDADGFIPHVHYMYEGDDLVEIHDALGQATRYRYDRHRIIHETLPTGLCFHFEYESEASEAACVRTWGDGGILDHRLIYDRARRTTVVINACNETTTYRADPRGLVTEIVDPRGAITRFTYDEHMHITEQVDALGHATRHDYDARGNCTRTTGPDGAVTLTEYHPRLPLPLVRTDPAGGVWRWTYDPCGRLLRATDPLGRSTVHHHELTGGSGHVEAIVYPDGRSELRTHDLAGRLVRHRPADGSKHVYHHDRRGRLRQQCDDRGRSETREYDLLDRLTRQALPDDETRLYTHDARGRVIRVCDDRSDLRCGYNGLGWLATCGEANAAPYILERDLEGRVGRVAGPAGTLLRIERDAAGHVRSTVDSLGIERRYTRDLLGRVIAVRRPGGKITRFTRDPSGRILEIVHDDGVRDSFAYRPDGALQAATRTGTDGRTTLVRRELDALGRVTREHQDDHAVALEYDLRDRLTRLRSSIGADLRFVYDDRGLARVELPHDPWALGFERDRDGLEQARHLPGEILGWWQNDRLGRPVEHGIVASRPPQIHRQRRYAWSGARLRRLEETARRRAAGLPPAVTVASPRYDAEGRRVGDDLSDGTSRSYTWSDAGELVGVTGPGTSITYRHDALGRRIARVRDGVETRWMWHGDVPLHSWTGHAWREAATWVFEPGGFAPLARLTPTSRHAFVSDHLGTPLAAFDERGQLAWSAEFDEHGQPHTARGDASVCPFRFPGQIADLDTGLSYNRFREYDPATRSYLSPDPIGLLGGLDPYAYVDDPQTRTDVYGLSADLPTGVHSRIAVECALDFAQTYSIPWVSAAAMRGSLLIDVRDVALVTLERPRRSSCE